MAWTVSKIEVRLSRKISKNYNSTEVCVGFEADVAGVDPDAVRAELGEMCREAIRAEFRVLGQEA